MSGFTLPTPADPTGGDVDLERFTESVGGLGSVLPAPVIDLNKSRARKAEATKRPASKLTVGDDTYDLPPELPLGVLDAFRRLQDEDLEALSDALRLLFPDVVEDRPDPTFEPDPDAPDVTAPLVPMIVRSATHELLYKHKLTLEEFRDEILGGIVNGYGIEGGPAFS